MYTRYRLLAVALLGTVGAGCGGGGGGGSDARSDATMFGRASFPPTAYNMLADVDEDGRNDLLLFEAQPGLPAYQNVYLRPGSDSSLFDAAQLAVGKQFVSVPPVVADFDGDAHLDILFAALDIILVPGNGDGTFDADRVVDPLTGYEARSLAPGDLDNDGDTDFIAILEDAPNTTAQYIVGFMNDGTGAFSKFFSNAPSARALASSPVDFDEDGILDVVVVGGDPLQYQLYFGFGGGAFGLPRSLASPAELNNGVAGDINGDQNLDYVAIGAGGGAVLQYVVNLGRGDGTFTALPPQSTEASLFAFLQSYNLLADLTGDGIVDLLVSALGHWLFEGNGDGTFGEAVLIADTDDPNAIVHDFTGDGINDVYAGVLLEGGDGIHAELPQMDTGASAEVYVALDLNGDVRDDLLLVGAALRAYVSDGGNGFSLSDSDPVPATAIDDGMATAHAADFDGDGLTDVVVLDGSFDTDVAVFLSQGDGTLELADTVDFGGSGHSVNLAVPTDLDGDGHLDLFGQEFVFSGPIQWSGAAIWVAFANGNGTFQPVVRPVNAFTGLPISIDIDNDGRRSLAFHDSDADLVRILHTLPNRTFVDGPTFASRPNSAANPIAVGRLNADGREDLVLMRDDDVVVTYFGNAQNTFDTGETFAFDDDALDASLGIIHGGSGVTIVFARTIGSRGTYRREIVAFLPAGGETFLPMPGLICSTGFGSATRIADLNLDGEPDLFTPWNGKAEIIRGQTGGGLQGPLYFELTPPDQSSVLALGDWDGDGDLDIATQTGTRIVISSNQL